MRKTTPFIRLISFLSIFLICVWIVSGTAYAATGIDGIGSGAGTNTSNTTTGSGTDDADKYSGTVYTNGETGYKVIIEDDAGLLTDNEKSRLAETMKDITPYGDVAFKSIDYNPYSTETYIERYYNSIFGTGSGTVFLIDMDNRNIWIYSDGSVYSTITTAYANVITDNVYTYASDRDYFTCANKAFIQEATLLQGRRISQPMKYISNALLAIAIAILINYFIVRQTSRVRKASDNEIVNGVFANNAFNNVSVNFIRQTRTYSPRSSSSSGSSGGHSGGGGGGGGHRGGGGGHSF
ncbi:MAG: TPM domain-containing protein [Clostridia bacterium]|nr:TPM domain-containing protein [Clostridia bacterium]